MRTRHALARTALGVFVVLPHFIMERKMMFDHQSLR
jgi:mannitol/fructose-specific phosphotransferase system IIA component